MCHSHSGCVRVLHKQLMDGFCTNIDKCRCNKYFMDKEKETLNAIEYSNFLKHLFTDLQQFLLPKLELDFRKRTRTATRRARSRATDRASRNCNDTDIKIEIFIFSHFWNSSLFVIMIVIGVVSFSSYFFRFFLWSTYFKYIDMADGH